MKPRRRYYSTISAALAILAAAAFIFHYAAGRVRSRAASSRIDDIEARLSSLAARVETLASKQSRGAVDPLSVEGNEPRSGESVGGSRPRPVFLGSGRTGSYFYSDIRYPTGDVRRYYIRTNATPRQVRSWVRSLSSDARTLVE